LQTPYHGIRVENPDECGNCQLQTETANRQLT
jgi:hypothetical protein